MKGHVFPRWRSWVCAAGLASVPFAGACLGADEEKMWLGGENPIHRDNPHYDNGYALRVTSPIKDLPKRIVFKPGVISLIADPTDKAGQFMVIWLVNDTDQPVPGIIGELNVVIGQVAHGGYWFPREILVADCGTVPPPADLPPRHALALGGLRHDLGDTQGEIRYVFSTPRGKIHSAPIQGRYFQNELRKVMENEYSRFHLLPDEDPIRIGIVQSGTEADMENFCAALELARNHRLALRWRSELMNWILERTAKGDATPGQTKAIETMKAVLSRPWMVAFDGQALAHRCIAALEAKPSMEYGTPEKCRAAVWRYLIHFPPGQYPLYPGHEARPADAESISRLHELATATLKSGDEAHADAAAEFLADAKTEALFPSEGFHQFIASGRPQRIRSGIMGLARRGKAEEVGPWLLDRASRKDPEAVSYYGMIRSSLRNPEPEWEGRLIGQLFDQRPLEMLGILSSSPRAGAPGKLPSDREAALRKFLRDQLSKERRQWWNSLAERDKRDGLKPNEKFLSQALSHGIRLMGSWKNPEDTPTLQAFLDHPAAQMAKYMGGSGTLFFTARETARRCLVERDIQVTDAHPTRIEFPKPAPAVSE